MSEHTCASVNVRWMEGMQKSRANSTLIEPVHLSNKGEAQGYTTIRPYSIITVIITVINATPWQGAIRATLWQKTRTPNEGRWRWVIKGSVLHYYSLLHKHTPVPKPMCTSCVNMWRKFVHTEVGGHRVRARFKDRCRIGPLYLPRAPSRPVCSLSCARQSRPQKHVIIWREAEQ